MLQARPEWLEKSDRAGAVGALQVFLPLIALLVLAPWLWLQVSPYAVALLVPLLGALIYKLTIVMHDCGHNTLFKTRRWNDFCGAFCGALLGSDFKTFTRQHWQHHQNYGEPGDPQGSDYLGLKQASRAHLAWHLLRPLLGYNLLLKLSLFQPPAPAADLPPSMQGSAYRTLAVILITQLGIAFLATGGGRVPWLVLLYPFCAATFALFFSQTRGFCEHVSNATAPEEAYVRTHLPNLFDRTFFYTLNFNYHVEHHLLPQVPSQHLPAVHDGMKASIHTDQTLSPSLWRTICHRFSEAPA